MTRRLVLVGALAIGVIVFVTYQPIVSSGFHFDDWRNVETVGRLGPWEYIGRSFNPMEPSFLNTYRPIQGLVFVLEYQVAGPSAEGYHFVHLLLHLANCLLIMLITGRLFRSSLTGILSGVFFASIAVSSTSVFLPSASDALAMVFLLLAIWFWITYLERGTKWGFALTHLCFVLALLSKEVAVTLPIVLLLTDWLARKKRRIADLFSDYALLGLIVCTFVVFELVAQPETVNYQSYGMRLGPHVFTNALGYLPALFFPWNGDVPSYAIWIWLILLIVTLISLRVSAKLLLYLVTWAAAGAIPALVLVNNFDMRFMYLAGIGPAGLVALTSDSIRRALILRRHVRVLLAIAISALVMLGAGGVQVAAQSYTADARASRTPFRDIVQQNPTLPPNAYLYFVDSPFWLNALSGMFFVRYGSSITVSGTNYNQKAELRAHASPLLYYFDSSKKPVYVAVQKDDDTNIVPRAPVTFGDTLALEGYEISSSRLGQGKDLVLLLYWNGIKKMDTDFQFFVHLVDGGKIIAGVDGPLGGTAPSSTWVPGTLIVDSVVLTIPEDAPLKKGYAMEVGVYYLPTMERLPISSDPQASGIDHVTIEPLTVDQSSTEG